jgi:hypothetical protein
VEEQVWERSMAVMIKMSAGLRNGRFEKLEVMFTVELPSMAVVSQLVVSHCDVVGAFSTMGGYG